MSRGIVVLIVILKLGVREYAPPEILHALRLTLMLQFQNIKEHKGVYIHTYSIYMHMYIHCTCTYTVSFANSLYNYQ